MLSHLSVPLTRSIEAIDKANRVVTLKGPAGNSVDVKAPDQMEGFNSLKVHRRNGNG
jgi:hypothetical protein